MLDFRVVELPPGGERPYDAAEWAGALVIVDRGEIELACSDGAARGSRAAPSCGWPGCRCGSCAIPDPCPPFSSPSVASRALNL